MSALLLVAALAAGSAALPTVAGAPAALLTAAPGFPELDVETGFVDPTFPDPSFPDAGATDGVFGLFMVVFVIGLVVTVVIGIRKLGAYHRHGIDPTTVDVDLAARLLKSEALRPEAVAAPVRADAPATDAVGARPETRSVEERLAEIDRLHDAGVIDDDERRDARADVLRDI